MCKNLFSFKNSQILGSLYNDLKVLCFRKEFIRSFKICSKVIFSRDFIFHTPNKKSHLESNFKF